MTHLPITIVITVLDEETSIRALITALAHQSLLPTEMILVDGGSTDKTRVVIEECREKYSQLPLRVLLAPGTNRSVARNIGITAATTEHIAVTDAGCVPDVDWLRELATPFLHDPDAEVVAGFYDPAPDTVLENVIANVTCTRSWNLNAEHYLPSSRSIAFTKTAWQLAGKYPEDLETCEDLVFAEQLKAKTTKWYVNPKAIVIWKQPTSLQQLREKVFRYALGDLEARYERHVKKIHAAAWRVFVLLVIALPLLFAAWQWLRLIGMGLIGLYVVGTWLKHRRVLRHPLAIVYTLLTQVIVDISLVQALLYSLLKKTVK